MKKGKLNFRFHNPNSPEATAEYIARIMIQTNKPKVDNAIQRAADELREEDNEQVFSM